MSNLAFGDKNTSALKLRQLDKNGIYMITVIDIVLLKVWVIILKETF